MDDIAAKEEEARKLRRLVKKWKADFEQTHGVKPSSSDYTKECSEWINGVKRLKAEIAQSKKSTELRDAQATQGNTSPSYHQQDLPSLQLALQQQQQQQQQQQEEEEDVPEQEQAMEGFTWGGEEIFTPVPSTHTNRSKVSASSAKLIVETAGFNDEELFKPVVIGNLKSVWNLSVAEAKELCPLLLMLPDKEIASIAAAHDRPPAELMPHLTGVLFGLFEPVEPGNVEDYSPTISCTMTGKEGRGGKREESHIEALHIRRGNEEVVDEKLKSTMNIKFSNPVRTKGRSVYSWFGDLHQEFSNTMRKIFISEHEKQVSWPIGNRDGTEKAIEHLMELPMSTSELLCRVRFTRHVEASILRQPNEAAALKGLYMLRSQNYTEASILCDILKDDFLDKRVRLRAKTLSVIFGAEMQRLLAIEQKVRRRLEKRWRPQPKAHFYRVVFLRILQLFTAICRKISRKSPRFME